jgi:hypothetical protein
MDERPTVQIQAWVANQAIVGISTEAKFPRNQVKPTATIGDPVRLSGRRHQGSGGHTVGSTNPKAMVCVAHRDRSPAEDRSATGHPEVADGGMLNHPRVVRASSWNGAHMGSGRET